MPSAAALRLQIETALSPRIPGALTPRPRILRDLAATGVPELDALLEGGFPIGAITELVGPQSSGRTSLTLATFAEMTQGGKTVAWIDTSDTFDPESAAAAGILLSRQLWVRCGQSSSTPHPSSAQTVAPLMVPGSGTPAPGGGCGSPHPRGEARGMSQAIDAFLQPDTFSRTLPPQHHYNQSRKNRIKPGTPSAPNRKLLTQTPLDRTPQDPRPIPRRAKDREEQIPTDRQPSRRQTLNTQQQRAPQSSPKSLQSAQVANTANAARNRPQPGHWTDNSNNAHGRAFHTPPNAIAAGLPRFREMEARAQAQGRNSPSTRVPQVPGSPSSLRGGVEVPGSPSSLRGGVEIPGSPSSLRGGVEVPGSPSSLRGGVEVPLSGPGFPGLHVMPPPSQLTIPNTKHLANKPSLAGEHLNKLTRSASPLWAALDQALRATDLLLSAGGFSAIVLDLGSIPPEFAWRIPLATWFRFRAAADRARTVLIVLTQHPCARSSAELVLRFTPAEPQSATTVLTGARFRVHLDRRRFETHPTPTPTASTTPTKLHLVPTRKQPQREAAWDRAAAWSPTAKTGTALRPAQGGRNV